MRKASRIPSLRLLGALRWAGSLAAFWSLPALAYFFATDGRTLTGREYRADPEFLRYWTVNLALLLVGAGTAEGAKRFGRRSTPDRSQPSPSGP